MSDSEPTSHMLVIDMTDGSSLAPYICAFITGQYGDGDVGDHIARKFSSDIQHVGWWETHVNREENEHGFGQTAISWETPGWFNNGMGTHYPDRPEFYAEAKRQAVEDMRKYHAASDAPIQHMLETGDFVANWTKEGCEQRLLRSQRSIEECQVSDIRYPAEFSVAIFVDEFPPAEVWEEFMERAELFARDPVAVIGENFGWPAGKPIEITGFRRLLPDLTLAEDAISSYTL